MGNLNIRFALTQSLKNFIFWKRIITSTKKVVYLHFSPGGSTTLLPCWPLTTRSNLPSYDWMPYSFWLSHFEEKLCPAPNLFPAPDLLPTEVDQRMPITLFMLARQETIFVTRTDSQTRPRYYTKDNKCGFEETLDNFCWCLSKNENCMLGSCILAYPCYRPDCGRWGYC